MGAFGEKLRKQREQRGLELDAISRTTKISTRMLRALEDEQFDQLPGGVFNKGFVRAYARQVGLNEEEAVADYLVALRESQIQQQTILPDFRGSSSKAASDFRRPSTPNPPPPVAPTFVNPRAHEPATLVPSAPPASPSLIAAALHPPETAPPEVRAKKEIVLEAPVSQAVERAGEAAKEVAHSQPEPMATDEPTQAVAQELRRQDRRRQDRRRQTNEADESDVHARGLMGPYAAAPIEESSNSLLQGGTPWRWLAAALAIVIFVVLIWNLRRQHEPSAGAQPEVSAPANAPAKTMPSTGANAATKPASARSAAPAPFAPAVGQAQPVSSAGGKPALGNGSGTKATASSSQSASASPAAPAPAKTPKPSRAENGNGAPETKPVVSTTARPHPAKPVPTFTLMIRADQTSWVAISADGKPVAQETLIAPAHTSVRAAHEIVVRAGNAGGISFVLNGKDVSARGTNGEAKTFVFDARGLRDAPSTP